MIPSLGAMGSLPRKLHSLVVSFNNELPDSLKDEIKLLIEDLEGACTFLEDLSRAEAPHTIVKLWRNEVCELSYDMEDYIDKTTQPYSNLFDVEEFGILVDLARDAFKSYHRYHLGRLWSSNPCFITGGQGRIPILLNREESYIVGSDETRNRLIGLLRDDAEKGLKVVAMHGPAGVGKTTLAQKVYREIGGGFEYCAFVRVSRMPDTRRLLRSMIFQIQRDEQPFYNCTVQKLIDSLREYLKNKRYFIVIDGLWEITSWDIIRSAFPAGENGGRILITADIEEVAQECCRDYDNNAIFPMEPFSRDYSAQLLSNRLSCHKDELTEQLRENLEDIIRTCGGLPLATISIANILASQPDKAELWCQVKGCLSSRLRNNLNSEVVLREIVGLSYDCLSHDLKICLLYLSMYPEGYSFLKDDLLRQWTAEGFISAAAQQNANEVAESYFDELVCRGLIQPNHADFLVSYTVHSTMFEVIRHKSTEQNFTTVIDYSKTMPELSAKVRRLSLRYSNAKYATKPEGITLSQVRSLMFYGFVECLPSIMEFEVLRVLILEDWGDQEEMDLSGIGRLFQLRYVQIKTNIVVRLPIEMSGLQYLETLEIYARVTSVPSDIFRLPKLSHRYIQGPAKEFGEPELCVPKASVGTSSSKVTKEQKNRAMWYDAPPPEILNPTHPAHKLQLMSTDAPFLCDGCKEPGYGHRYTCDCSDGNSFDLHTRCAIALLPDYDTLVHPLFPDCTFKFLREPPPPVGSRICDACGQPALGFVYHCFEKGLDLHPCCASLTERIIHDGRVFKLRRKLSQPCALCGSRRRKFWAYRTHFDGEAVDLHVACMKDMARLSWEAAWQQKQTQKKRQEVNDAAKAEVKEEDEKGKRGGEKQEEEPLNLLAAGTAGTSYRNSLGGIYRRIVQARAMASVDRILHNLTHTQKTSTGFNQFRRSANTVTSVIISNIFGDRWP